MNKSNVLEIKKTFKLSPEDIPSIDTICTCFVNGNKEKLISNTERFSSLDEEEQFKYLELLKGTLSGTIGKKLINLPVTDSKSLLSVKDGLSGQTSKDELFDRIIKSYDFGENYLIVIAHGIYDAPVKTSDGKALEDETDTYDFMLCAICPVHSTKAGLTLNTRTERMESAGQIQIIQSPINGFLYPAFNDRQTDPDNMLFFTKKPEEQPKELLEELTGLEPPTSSVEQQLIFEKIIAEVTDDKADIEVVKNIQENLTQIVEDQKMSPDDKILSREDIRDVLIGAGIDKNKLSDFEHIYERAGGEEKTSFKPQNLVTLDKFMIKTPDIEIKIKPDKRRLLRQEKISGKNCIVVEIEDSDIELNGIKVKG